MTTGTRARRRQELLDAVRAAALEELRRSGAAGLSLRAVAREVGIAVSALYRYFPSRDELLTDLIVAAFDAHADAVEVAAAEAEERDGVVAALREVLHAYRAWAVAHPAEFGLAYGAPVPGYVAPPERTREAGTRIGRYALGLLVRAQAEGRLDPEALRARAARLAPATAAQLVAWADRHGHEAPTPLLAVWLDLYVHLHGLVSMEVFGLLRPVVPDAAPYAAEVVGAALDTLVAERLHSPGYARFGPIG